MSSPRQTLPPGLEDLLRAFRAAGLPVGPREVLWLHRVFRLEPALAQEREPSDQLRRILAAALVHSPADQKTFDAVFRAWRQRCDHWEHDQLSALQKRAEPAPADGAVPEPLVPARQPTRRRWPWVLATALLALAVAAILWRLSSRTAPIEPPEEISAEEPSTSPALPVGEFRIEDSEPGPAEPAEDAPPDVTPFDPLTFGPPLAGLILLGAAGLISLAYRKRQRSPPPKEGPSLPGPVRVPYLPLLESGPELLEGDGARALIWGVDRHQTEETTPELDLERTVDETARAAGIPELRFSPEQRLREVWLWVDGTIEDPAVERYAEEIAAALEAAGLRARIAAFDGYPLELVWDEGQRFRPQELEGHRQTALVAVMTDGAVLTKHAHDNHRGSIRALLRSLATWERLVFVDFSGHPGLTELLAEHRLPCIAPEALPFFFGQRGAVLPARRRTAPAEARAWAAALALSPRPITRSEAYRLRRELGLEVSPWDLSEPAPGASEDLLWLHHASGPGLPRGSHLDRALAFWEWRLAEEDRRRRERGALEAWEERPARRYLEMERAFLRLARDPDLATEELTALAALDERLEAEIRRRLAAHTAADNPATGRVPLPWRLGELTAATRQRLGELGLEIGAGESRAPGQLGLALGFLTGLGMLFLAQGMWELTRAQRIPVALLPSGECPRRVGVHEPTGIRFVRVCAGRFRMGSVDDPEAEDDEKPAHVVALSEFWIGELEISNAEYRQWQPGHDPERPADWPAVNVSWEEARQFCRWLGESEPEGEYDLPTEAQWEYAARGPASQRYPWGDEPPNDELAVFGRDLSSSPEAVGSRARGAGPFGTLDQAGNVWEWARDCYDAEAYAGRAGRLAEDPEMMDEAHCDTWTDLTNLPLPEGWNGDASLRVVRGGSFRSMSRWLRSADRNRSLPEFRNVFLGFRCIRGPRPQP